MPNVIEILQYTLTSGSGAVFHNIMTHQSVPLHQKSGIQVVRYGNSLHDHDRYYLVRSFPGFAEMEEQLKQFYGQRSWQEGPRCDIISMIIESHRVVMYENTF